MPWRDAVDVRPNAGDAPDATSSDSHEEPQPATGVDAATPLGPDAPDGVKQDAAASDDASDDVSARDNDVLKDGAASDAADADATIAGPTWCEQAQQLGSTVCVDFDEPPDGSYAVLVSAGSVLARVGDAGDSASVAMLSTLVAPPQTSVSAEVTTSVPAADAGMFVLNFSIWVQPDCQILPLQKVFLATLTSDEVSFYGPVLLNDGNGAYELRPGHLTENLAYVLDVGVPVSVGTWVGIHYAYCPSIGQDAVATSPAPSACQTPPKSGIASSTLAVGLRSDFEEGSLQCTVLYDDVSLVEY